MAKKSTSYERVHPVFIEEQHANRIAETTDGDPVTVLNWDPDLSLATINDPEHYMPLLFRENRANAVVLAGTGTNRWTQLENLARSMPGGPWHLDGTDNQLKIHNSKANRKAIAEYTYAGGSGELLEFDIETKYMTQTVDAEKATDIDPDTGEIDTVMVQGVYDDNAVYDKGRIRWWNQSNEPPKIAADKTRVWRQNPETLFNFKGKRKVSQEDFIDPEGGAPKIQHYKSVNDAVAAEEKDFEITEDVVKEYVQGSVQRFNDRISKQPSGNNPNDYIDYIIEATQAANNLDGFTVKKKVYIQESVNPAEYAWDVNNPNPGKLKVYTAPSAQDSFWRTGYRHLQNAPDVVVVGEGHSQGSMVDIIREHEVEVNIEAARILASPYLKDLDYQMANDIILSTQNRIKAKGEFIGNPILENSQTIQINNISKRYSGAWYSKKVKHSMTNTEYTTSVEFNQKTTPAAKNTISAKINTQKIYADINKVAQESIKTEAYKIPSQIAATVRQWREDNREELQGYSLYVVPDETGTNLSVYKSREDFSASTTKETEFKVNKVTE